MTPLAGAGREAGATLAKGRLASLSVVGSPFASTTAPAARDEDTSRHRLPRPGARGTTEGVRAMKLRHCYTSNEMAALLGRITTRDESGGGDPVRGIYLDGTRVGCVAQDPSCRPLSWIAVKEVPLPDGRTGYAGSHGWASEMKAAALHLPALAPLVSELDRGRLLMGGHWANR